MCLLMATKKSRGVIHPSRAGNGGAVVVTADEREIVGGIWLAALPGIAFKRERATMKIDAGSRRSRAARLRGARRAGRPGAQVPATEVLVTDEPVTTEWMTRSRSNTTEKPL